MINSSLHVQLHPNNFKYTKTDSPIEHDDGHIDKKHKVCNDKEYNVNMDKAFRNSFKNNMYGSISKDRNIPNEFDYTWSNHRHVFIYNRPTTVEERKVIISKCWGIERQLVCEYMASNELIYDEILNNNYQISIPDKFDIPNGLFSTIPKCCTFQLTSDNSTWNIQDKIEDNSRVNKSYISSNMFTLPPVKTDINIYKNMNNYHILTDNDIHRYKNHYFFLLVSKDAWVLAKIRRLTKNGMPSTIKCMFEINGNKVKHKKRVNAIFHWSSDEIKQIRVNDHHILNKYINL